MRIVISDTSCLIDLRKGGLLTGLLALPYQFAIPLPLFEDELLDMSVRDKDLLVKAGLEVWDLSGEQVDRSGAIQQQNRSLTINDCFAFVAAADVPRSILLTGDGPLRRFAAAQAVEVHGVLWVIDEMHAAAILPPHALYRALVIFDDDPTVWLPSTEHSRRLHKFRRLSQQKL
ncbi:MAG: type II toxin-antitoxin system VapC family toxin [Pseudomonadota bacterium]